MRNLQRRRRDRGFTLIELVFVLALLIILMGILTPKYVKFVEKARMSADASNLDEVATAVKVAVVDGDYNVAEGRYVFTLDASGLTVTAYKGGSNLFIGPSGVADLERGLASFLGGTWKIDGHTVNPIVKLRYKKWTDENKPSQKVQLICQVDGRKVATKYLPEALENFIAMAKKPGAA